MHVAADSLTGFPARNKIVTAEEAVRLIGDGDCVAVEGFAGQGYAEELVLALEERFVRTGSPRDISLVFCVAVGNGHGRGIDHLAHEGLVAKAYGGHWGLAPAMQKLAIENKIEAWNLPQGVISQLFRDTAAGKPGLLSRVGLGTFVDPRNGGGKINDLTVEDRVVLMEVGGEEFLFYKALPVDVAFLRGTTADPDGNVTMEQEALTLEAQAIATATHNSGGLVIVQALRLAERGTLNPRQVKIPGVLVDCVVPATPEHHHQTLGTDYSPAYSGELRIPLDSIPAMPLDARKVAARRAAQELRPNMVVNLGIGMPEGVANVANEERILGLVTLTAEPGAIGGLPVGGLNFGSAVNASAILDQPAQFDFYDGGGLDLAVLGMAQVDQRGNVNVSRFGPRLAGSGGFINISQNAKRLVFVGTFLAPSRTEVVDGALVTSAEVAASKVVDRVDQVTFSGEFAAGRHQPVLYVTERCVFTLTPEGIRLDEIAPGLDLQRDILAHLNFEPIISEDLRLMDARLFREGRIGIDDDLQVPLASRFAYDEKRNIFFLNMEAMALRTEQDVDEIVNAVDERLAAIGRKVQMVINYDNFSLPSELSERYLTGVRTLAAKYYSSVTRYTTSSFMRLKLSEGLKNRGMSPYMFESAAEAQSWRERQERERQEEEERRAASSAS